MIVPHDYPLFLFVRVCTSYKDVLFFLVNGLGVGQGYIFPIASTRLNNKISFLLLASIIALILWLGLCVVKQKQG